MLMKTIDYNTSRRTRRETFPDGSQLGRQAGGGYEIIEAWQKYGVAAAKPSNARTPSKPRMP